MDMLYSLQNGGTCWCNGRIDSSPSSLECYNENAKRCSGDRNTICGASNAMSIYRGRLWLVYCLATPAYTKDIHCHGIVHLLGPSTCKSEI